MATGISNAELAQAIQSLIEASDAREQDLANWQEGSPTGGPNGDGRYPLRNYRGEVRYFKSPQRLEYEVDQVVLSASAHADRAEIARNDAVQAVATIGSSLVAAQNASASAAASAAQADGFRQQAASSEANALAHRNAASSSATAAANSAKQASDAKTLAEAARNAAQAAEADAEAHAANAAASADRAALFDPARYYFKTEVDTLLAGKSNTGHNHDDRYFTEYELTDGGVLDVRYFTETELLNGALDSRYYTKGQAEGAFAAAVHSHPYLPLTGGTMTGLIGHNGGDVAAIVKSYNTSAAGSPLQFFLEHSYGGVNLGNNRGPMSYFGTDHAFSSNVRSSKAFVSTGLEGGWTGPGTFLDYDAAQNRGRLGTYDYTQKRWLPIEIDRGNAGTLTGGTLQAKGMLRAAGWWGTVGSSFSGLAAEIGISGGKAFLLSYNRDNNTYGSFELNADHIKLAPVGGGTVEVASGMSVGSTLNVSGAALANSFQGNANVGGTGNASYHPSGIYSRGTNWLYGEIIINSGWRLQERTGGYAQFSNWVHLNGSYGFYSGINDAHFCPNELSEYGAWAVQGSRGGYGGFNFQSAGYRPHLMFATSGHGGLYYRDSAKWAFYADPSTGSLCVGGRTGHDANYGLLSARSIYAEGDIVAYSDRRKKDDIRTIESALEKVARMRGVTFIKKGDEALRRRMGVIAQEMLEVAPEVVDLLSDGTYAVAYGNLVGILIEAIKELKERLDGIDP